MSSSSDSESNPGTTPRHAHSLSSTPKSSPLFRDSGSGSAQESSSLSRLHSAHRSSQDEKIHLRARRKVGRVWHRRRVKVIVGVIGSVGLFFLTNWWMLSRLYDAGRGVKSSSRIANSSLISVQGGLKKLNKGKRPQIHSRMLALAAHALADGQNKPEPKGLWEEPMVPASVWRPCAHQRNWEPSEGNNGYILVTANGGINQQRVAVCNAVVIARFLNATLVVPKFLFSSVWRDVSQFSDIYQEEHFVNYLTPDIRIVKELPKELQSLDLEAIGSVVTDVDIMKESKLSFYRKNILPILLQKRVVHFVGFGNRLAFDPIPFELQRLRCRCNFHALRFVPKIQETGALLLKKMRQNVRRSGPLDHYLVGPFAESTMKGKKNRATKSSRYLALHLRFEIDMVAHSLCDFGGGEEERQELEAFREIHFPALALLKKTTKLPSPEELRADGQCPLTPEETVLMLVALGFNRKTHIFLAGSQIYGGRSRLAALTTLYPNLVTKENLLSSSEIEPFKNFSSQLAALDFIGCTAADAFAITDSGSQLSSLVSGYRIYYGGGRLPTVRPNKRRLASIFLKNSTIEWSMFEKRVRKAVRQTKTIHRRSISRSVYRNPRCRECMCTTE
ncbi:O-fucosyltransferase 15-like [Vitis riparia]|uniref:O-fucosyltransferase 15-like n=1 Tax=Vitis riparia TaxID=96939 RepID=UPI00155B041D|nr:O-fucosyltransferase 15-like [Vitis riparia]